MSEITNSNKAESFHRKKSKDEMKKQLISFALMIVFTIIAFTIVATNSMEKIYAIPVLIIMALVQVAFQFYYFMHLKEKDHELPAILLYGGVWAALLTLAALGVITWW